MTDDSEGFQFSLVNPIKHGGCFLMENAMSRCAEAVVLIDDYLLKNQKAGAYDSWLERYAKKPEDHSDSFIFGKMVQAMFSGGMNGKVVDSWMPRMKVAFYGWDVLKIAELSKASIDALASSGSVISNRPKLDGVVINAKQARDLVLEYGTFGRYLLSFKSTHSLSVDLIKHFSFLGPVTTEDFLRNVGFDTAKPDRHLTRWLNRMQVVDDSASTEQIIGTVRALSAKAKLPQSRIDAALYLFCADRDDVIEGGICSLKPNCGRCPVSSICPQEIVGHNVVKEVRPTRQKDSVKSSIAPKHKCKPNSVWATCYPGKSIEEIKTINPFALPSWLRQPYGKNGSRDRFSDINKLFAGGSKVNEAIISEVDPNEGKYVAFRAIVHQYAAWDNGLLVIVDK